MKRNRHDRGQDGGHNGGEGSGDTMNLVREVRLPASGASPTAELWQQEVEAEAVYASNTTSSVQTPLLAFKHHF